MSLRPSLKHEHNRDLGCPEPDADGFGRIIWLILRGKDMDRFLAATQLQIKPTYLKRIIAGKRGISQRLINKNKWRDVFREYYPDTWAQYGGCFDKWILTLRSRPVGRHKERDDVGCPEPDADGFGRAVWLILRGENINRSVAAKRLKMRPILLDPIISGEKKISQHYVNKNKWRDVFKKYYSGTWAQHEAYFEKWFATLQSWQAGKSKKPEDEKSFGFVLWRIIGGEDAHIGKAAKLLRVRGGYLTSILHGKETISTETIMAKNWPDILQENFLETWKIYRKQFMRLAGADAKRSGPRAGEPENKNGLEHLVWRMIGGRHAYMAGAAQFLEIKENKLTRFLHGYDHLTQEAVEKMQLRRLLERLKPKKRRTYQRKFDELVAALPVDTKAKLAVMRASRLSVKESWQDAAGRLVGRILKENGDEIEDIIDAVQAPELANPTIWRDIMGGDARVTPVRYRQALDEICGLYHLSERPGKRYASVMALRKKVMAHCAQPFV